MRALMKVVKRDGSVVDYDRSKIITAIQKANAEVSEEEQLSLDRIEAIVSRIEDLGRDKLPVEEIQEMCIRDRSRRTHRACSTCPHTRPCRCRPSRTSS